MSDTTPHKPTKTLRDQVYKFASVLGTDEEISFVIGIAEETLRKHYRSELDVGRAASKLYVKDRLRTLIDKLEPSAIYFYLKTKCQWRETDDLENFRARTRAVNSDSL
jgi:hypothetical protein